MRAVSSVNKDQRMRLLLVEDDTMIGEAVLDALRGAHYAVDWVRDGKLADAALRSEDYDLVLVDLGRPRRATRWASASPGWMPAPMTMWTNPMTPTSCWRAYAR